ncbi:glucose-repressible alcohol dehydrogenase transcriptional effector [Gaeumannomyces tritici R3-111a-1]|uniref:CCR4-Not complex 3'-5'-exoribonuclease subunit Ccr4 n=1 Tax=Gaeumannomyces tritici (strain R3-111a-1) TaxID=644352 RepID=J3NXL5_GAET3|nr:glucose-repressible alcohol dehydrogenase transcriptional effector [Gaeumannomyces tritici R3-111a-1]EJT76097.1 glucose-repressible alcohol dehydrogenase transcriptional effector [Gaeumannomyces tritici R3-111a-1]
MADGPRYLQQSTGPAFYQQHAPQKPPLPSGALLPSLLHPFLTTNPPSPSRSPDRQGAHAQPLQGMYNHNQQQGHNSRLNNNPQGQRMPIHYNFQQPAGLQHQSHAQHHPSLQQEPSGQGGNAGVLGHHSTYSSGVLSNASPFSANLPNGHNSVTRGGQAQPITEGWAEQLRMYKDAERAHASMMEQPHYYARLKAPENRNATSPAAGATSTAEGEVEDRRRPGAVQIAKSSKQQYWTNLDMSGQQIRSLSMSLFNYIFLQELYICSNKLTTLTPAIGELRQLRILDASHNQLTDLPAEIGMCTFLKHLLLFNNHIHTLPHEIGSLHLLEQLGIEGNPLDPDTKNIVKTSGTATLVKDLLEKQPVPMPPLPRKMLTIQEDVSPSLERIKVFSWNILASRYATAMLYGYTPSGALEWDYRRRKIYQEIRDRDPDFLCLQEVTTNAFTEDFSPELARQDYKGIHFPRTKARLMNEKEGANVDGCAIFYKGSKFILLDKQVIEMSNIALNRADMKTGNDIFNRVMPKDNICVMGFFESRRTGARMIVMNAHLAWEGTLADVKIVQTAIMLESLTKFADKYARWPACKDKKMIRLPTSDSDDGEGEDGSWKKEEEVVIEPAPSQEYRSNTDIPLFVCGDYNSTAQSGVFELLSKGRLAPDHPELAKHSYGLFTRDGIEHPFSLRSSYQPLVGTPEEMPFTNYVPDFANVIDYIWYSSNNLEVVELLGPPDAQHLKRVPGFPNYHFPSDHIQIMAEFVIKARKDKKGGGQASSS